ncbi:MAG: ORF6N domain-containing protein [Planctomycetes bacterium]|nr:ORF6N domain-containing protein [Planctomycetota bacterium]
MKPSKPIETLILNMRGHKVILDADLAELYGVPTYRFNEAFKRNRQRFPDDFAYQLTAAEFAELKIKLAMSKAQGLANKGDMTNSSQIAMSSPNVTDGPPSSSQIVVSSSQGPNNDPNWSQFVTSSKKHRGTAYRPWAFTEHGALMAANILRSDRAVEMSVFVIRAFVRIREQIAANAAVLKRLAEIAKTLLGHDSALRDVYRKLLPLLQPPPDPPKRRIGFNRDNE